MEILKNQTIREYLSDTGLLLEADEVLGETNIVSAYYGINVSKTDREPIDQIQGPIMLKRIQERNLANFDKKGATIVFIGGLFEILNTKDLDELEQLVKENYKKEKSKLKLYRKISDKFNLDVQILTTENLWQDPMYWEIVYELVVKQVFTRGNLMNDTLNFYSSKDELMNVIRLKEISKKYINLPLNVLKKIGNWPAPLLYTPVQVAEGLYLKKKFGINAKVGQLQERVYDKYLKGELNTYRLKQSVDLLSRRDKVQVVTPYIDKDKNKDQSRIYFDESKESLKQKITPIKIENYIFTTDEKYCEVLNPIIEKAIYVVESARAQEKLPIEIGKEEVYSGGELINLLEKGQITIEGIKKMLAELMIDFIVNLS